MDFQNVNMVLPLLLLWVTDLSVSRGVVYGVCVVACVVACVESCVVRFVVWRVGVVWGVA